MYNHTMNYKLSLIPTGILHVNTWFFFKDNSLYLIDPGGDPDKIISHIEKEWENYLKKSYLEQKNIFILLTHCHFDHISAIPELLDYFPKARLFAHEKDAEVLGKGSRERIIRQARWCGIENFGNFLKKDIPLPEKLTGESKIGPFKVIHTPGHTPGSCCYYWEAGNILFSGDTLFYGSYGRTDFPGGNGIEMAASLKKLSILPKKTLVLPGHGEYTTIEAEETTFNTLS